MHVHLIVGLRHWPGPVFQHHRGTDQRSSLSPRAPPSSCWHAGIRDSLQTNDQTRGVLLVSQERAEVELWHSSIVLSEVIQPGRAQLPAMECFQSILDTGRPGNDCRTYDRSSVRRKEIRAKA